MNCIIVEDEFPAREELKYFINNFSNLKIDSEFDNGVDVLKYLQENSVDVIFLDINIPLIDGMMLAKIVNKFIKKPKIVIITANKDYAVDAFELDVFDYILKPYTEQRIIEVLQKLKSSESSVNEENAVNNFINRNSNTKVSLWRDNKLIVVDVNDIYYCQASERETFVFTKDYKYVVNMSISEFEKIIPSDIFLRTHRSYIVNLSKINEIVPWFNSTYLLRFNNIKGEVPVSRSKIKQFKALMNI